MANDLVDSHQHFWQVGRFDYPWMTPEVDLLCCDYLPDMLAPVLQRNGVARTVLVQASNSTEAKMRCKSMGNSCAAALQNGGRSR